MAQLSAKISADTSEFKKAVGDAQRMLKAFTAEESATAQTMRKLYDVSQSQVNAFKKSVEAINKATDGTKTNKQASAALAKEIEKLRQQWDMLSNSAKNSKFGQNLSKTIKESEARMKSLQTQAQGVTKANAGASGSMANVTNGLTAMATKVVAVGAVLDQLKRIVTSTETGFDDFSRMVEQGSSALKTFYSSVANNTTITAFVNNLQDATDAAARLYDTVDALGTMQGLNSASLTVIDNEIKLLEQKRKLGEKIDDDRLKRLENERKAIIKQQVEQGKLASLRQMEASIIEQGGNKTAARFMARSLKDQAAKGGNIYDFFETQKAQINDILKKYDLPSVGKVDMMKAEGKMSKADFQALKNVTALINAEAGITKALKYYEDAVRLSTQNIQNEIKEAKWNKETGSTAKRDKLDLGVDVGQIAADRMAVSTTGPGSKSINAQMASTLESYDYKKGYRARVDAAKKAKAEEDAIFAKEFPKNTLSGLQSLSSETQNLYNSLASLGNIENPFQAFDALIGTAQSVMSVVETVGQLGDALNKMSSISSATTATEIANTQAKIAANNTETASETVNATAKTFDAHAAIPFVGIAIAGAMVAAMIASIVASKSKTPKFANGGIISGPTLGVMGEYPGAQNNPEVVAPLNKLRGMLKDDSSAGGEVQFRIDGRTLVGVLNKQNNYSSRQ